MSTEKTINNSIRANLLSNEDFVYAHLVKFERPFTKKADGAYPTDDSRYAYYTDGSFDIVFGGNTYYANRILSVGNYSETTQPRASAMSLTLAGEDLKPAISVAGSISTSGVFTPTSTIYEGYPLDFVERGFKEGDEISFTYSSTTLTYRISSFTSDNTVLNLSVIGTSPDIVSSFPGSTLSQTFSIKLESDELTAPLQDRGITVEGTSAASPNFINRSVLIDKVFIDPNDNTIWGNEAIRIFKGVIQSVAIDEKGTGVQVKWGLNSHWGDWNEVGGRLTTDEVHRNIAPDGQPSEVQPIRNEYGSDLGFLHAESSLSAIATYKTQETRTRMRSKKRGGLAGLTGGKRYWQEEFQVDVQNEVDLNIHLQGRYLPVVYGVQRINGNPIFADTLNYNSQVVYTADAICEGEIHGIYNIYIDDVPLICTDDNDFDNRGPGGLDVSNTQLQCYGRMSYGDTLNGKQGEILSETDDTEPVTVRVDGGGVVKLPIRIAPNAARGGSTSINPGIVNDHLMQQGLITGTVGVGHRESWSINQPYPIDQSVFQGRPNQLASSMLYNPAKVTDGIEGVRVTSGGYGYTSDPQVTISAPSGGGTTATATASRTKDDDGELTKVGAITISNPGSGYTAADTVVVTISGGGGNGARGQADRGGYKRQTAYYTGTEPYWSSNHRLLDTAYTANRFNIGAEATEIPEIEYVVRGSVIDCFNYDNTYIPDAVLGTSNTHTNFNSGDLVTIQYSTNGSSWTTDTSGDYSGQFKIMDKFFFQSNRGISEYRFRLDKTPSLAITNGSPARTRLRMVDSSNNYWYMITWNHTLCTDETFPNEFKTATWSVNTDTGDLTATFSGSDATILKATDADNNIYQFYSDDWTGLPNLEFGLLPGTWSGNALTFKAGLVGLTSTALTNFNDHVKVRLGRLFDMTNVSAVANITDTNELVSTFVKVDLEGTNRTYPGRGCMLQNLTTGEEREIESFNTSTNIITLVTAFYTPPTNSHKFTITGRGADKRASINPAIQTLDYLRSKRYGKGLEDDDLDINSFITSAKLCDARSDIEIKLESASSIAVNDIYELKTGGDSNSGTIVAQGKVTKVDTTDNVITLTDVINKFTKLYSTYGSYQEGDIIYTTAGRYYRAQTTVTNTSTTEPTHGGTTNGMTFIGSYTDGDSDNADLTLHKASGSGPSTIKMLKSKGNPVEYALYDSDFIKYWRYYGWERNHQAEVTRHQTNFILDTGKPLFENINSLLSHFNGILSYENGKYVLDVETQENAPTATLNANQENINPYYIENSDIIGKINLKDDSQKKGKNTIKASVADPQNNWGSRSITFFNSDFLKADRDITKTANFPFTGITNYYNGRIGVEKELFQTRFSKEINFTIGPRGLLLKAGQVMAITYDSFGWSSKLFRINNLNFNANCTVTVKATEYDDSIYEITKQQATNINQQSAANYSIKPIAAPTLAAPSIDKSGSIILSWTNGADFNELTDSTEIFVSDSNNRGSSVLLAIVDNAETFTHTTAIQNDKYYWVRHRRITAPKAKTTLTHSDYHPLSKTGGLQGVSQSISAGAATIELVPSTHVIDYSKAGVETTTVSFSTTTFNMTGTIYYEFLVGTTSKQNGTTSTFTLADGDEPASNGVPIQVTVKARQSATDGTLLASDIVTIHAVQDGQDTVTGVLTNEAHSIPADVSGNVSATNLNNAGGTFQVFYGNALQNGNVADDKISFSIAGSAIGCTASINENTGVYSISAMSADQGTVTFQCTLEGSLVGGIDNTDDVTISKLYTIAKSQTGATGDQGPAGSASLSGFLTQEAASAAFFGNHRAGFDLIASYANTGGEFKVFEGTSEKTSGVAYSITGGSSSSGSTSKTQNGLTLTINESTGVYTASGASWTTDKEEFTLTGTVGSSVVTKLYVIDKKPFFTITNLTASEQSFNYDGASSNPSPSSITLTASAPVGYNIFGGATYQYKFSKSTDGGGSFSTVQDYSTSNTLSVSAGAFSLGNEVFKVEVRNAYSTSVILDDDQITLIRIKEGATGSTGDKSAIAKIYQTTTTDSAPAVINDTSTYTFATGLVTNSNGMDGWSNTIPSDADAKFLWTCQALATASGTSTTDSILTGDWSTPVKQAIPQKARTKRLIIYNPSTARTGVTAPTNTTSGTPFNFDTNTLTIGSGGTSGWTNTIQYGTHWTSLVFIVEATVGGTQTVTYNTPFRVGDFGFLDRSDFSIQIPDDNTKKFRFRFLPTDDYTDVTLPDRYVNDTIDQTFIADKITNVGNFRSSIGAGTSSFDGDYSNLSNTPTIPTAGTGANNFLAGNTTIPTNTNQLTNGANFITGIDSSAVTGALGFTPYNATNPTGFITGINSTLVTNALGFTPANVTAIPSEGDFDITQLDGYSDAAYANASLGWGNISVTVGSVSTTWGYNGTSYTPAATTQTLTMAISHPSLGTSTVVGTWTRSGTAVVSGFALASGSGASGSGTNTWTFGDVNSDAGSADNAFGSSTASYGEKKIYVQHSSSNKILEITGQVLNTNFSIKCLTPAMLPENLQIGDEVDSPQGKTKVIDMQYKEREGYWILENELEITNDHPILIDGEWILAEEYAGKKEYIDKPTEVVYVETENELLTVKDWTVGGKY